MKIQIYRALGYRICYEKMLETYPALANYNFKIDKSGDGYVTITSLKQLMQMVKEIGQEIILSSDGDGIEIYVDYRE